MGSAPAKAAPVTGERALLNHVDANDAESASVRVREARQSVATIDGERALLEPEAASGRRSTHERSGAVAGRAFDGLMALLNRPGY